MPIRFFWESKIITIIQVQPHNGVALFVMATRKMGIVLARVPI